MNRVLASGCIAMAALIQFPDFGRALLWIVFMIVAMALFVKKERN